MGCWCETDGVTQLPINAGDKVRLFVLVHDSCYRFMDGGGAGGGTCYSTDIWSPLGPAIQGTYDDYGGIENIVENDDTKILSEVIREGALPITSHEWDKVSPIAEMKLEEMLHWIERDKVAFPKNHPEMHNRHLGQMMVHEAVYQAMIGHDFIDSDHDYNGKRSWVYRPWNEIQSRRFKEWYDNALGTYKDLGSLEDLAKEAVKEFRLESMIDLTDHFFGWHSESGWKGVRPHRAKLLELARQGVPFEDERVQKLGNSVLELMRFSRAMNDARKMWMPQSGKGGQHNELYVYRRINAAVNQVMADREEEQRKWAEEDGEEYEPDIDPLKMSQYQIEHNQKVLEEDAESKGSDGSDECKVDADRLAESPVSEDGK